MLTGSCLCGCVSYQIDDQIEEIFFCHCAKCRKATGSAFNSATPVKMERFTLLTGEDKLKSFSSSPGVHRFFCADCGSPLYSGRDGQPELIRLRIGTLDTPIHPEHKTHIFTGSKAEWFELCDDNPKFEERP